ncbi:hypothetical protein D869_gp112 [Caulobacter phage CcrRogue]|uniref:Uncharacterized protein n=1 Tax=Caulobacter phage CcrRogue TaxID=2927986 RepID=K4K3H8_9CAUD|nr:hypothetical protein D869_gp112 [Caulobacter phage CcrRogue]AFU86802.1 hypothetical protein CcrRogue_gp320 [Caulobacter phage CcrRogue]
MRSAGAQFLDVINAIGLYPSETAKLLHVEGDRFVLEVPRRERWTIGGDYGYVALNPQGRVVYAAHPALAKPWRRRTFEEAVRTSPGWLALEVTARDQNLTPVGYTLRAVR